jgi:hypothetical protein
MANTALKATDVRYVNKDFESFKRDLMRYAQAHFSGSFRDYNEVSPGMTILELQAYVADVLSYYMDQQFLEIKQETARQIDNVEAFAKMRGYKPKGKRAARVTEQFVIEVPASSTAGKPGPDLSLVQRMLAGSQVQGPNGTTFETMDDVDFSQFKAGDVQPTQFDKGGHATFYAVRASVDCIGAKTSSEVITAPETFTSLLKLPLGQSDVIEVIDVKDQQGNTWYEVDWLAQSVVYDQIVNTGPDQSLVPYVLRWRAAPRRFVVERRLSDASTFLQFGNGQGLQYNDELIPSISNMALPIPGRKTFTNFAIDPQNFLKTSTLGLSPWNSTKLLVRYRVGGGTETNVDAFTINKPSMILWEAIPGSVDQAKAIAIRSTIECSNLIPSEGGGPAETIDEIKSNAGSYFAAQQRAVTKDDYLAHIFTMPERFGRVEKAYVKPSEYNAYAVDVHVLSVDSNGLLQVPSVTLQQNIKTYLSKLRMITEGINILPAYVIDVGVNFGVVVSPQFNRSEVLTNCMNVIKDYLRVDNMQIGEPLVLSDIRAQLQNVVGVISVYKFDVSSFYGVNPDTGLSYRSDISFDVTANTKHGIVYVPADSVFQVHYPDRDIVGEAK